MQRKFVHVNKTPYPINVLTLGRKCSKIMKIESFSCLMLNLVILLNAQITNGGLKICSVWMTGMHIVVFEIHSGPLCSSIFCARKRNPCIKVAIVRKRQDSMTRSIGFTGKHCNFQSGVESVSVDFHEK